MGIGNMRLRPSYAIIVFVIMGLTLLSTISIPITNSNVVIRTAFVVDSGMSYGPYDDDTLYHTGIFGNSTLRGNIYIVEDGIYLTVNGENTQHLKDVYISNRFAFEIVPAIDQYTFEFDNTNGVAAIEVYFVLENVWTGPIAMSSTTIWGIWLVGGFAFLIGFLGLVIVRLRNQFTNTPASNDEKDSLDIELE